MGAEDTAIAARIIEFIQEIGLTVRCTRLPFTTFLPGIHLAEGALCVDMETLAWPADLLHEAGHVAITPSTQRHHLTGCIPPGLSEEMAAIAWSYAAAVHLGLDPGILFHPDGYGIDSARLVENFTEGRYFGVPVLQYLGMALGPDTAGCTGGPAYPHMLQWLCP